MGSLLIHYPQEGLEVFLDWLCIVICSNKHPKDIYNKSDEDINQLIRRIDHILDFDDPAQYAQTQMLGNTIPTSSPTAEQMQLHNN